MERVRELFSFKSHKNIVVLLMSNSPPCLLSLTDSLTHSRRSQLGLMATGSRIGSMGSSLLFGGLLVNNGWRTLFQVVRESRNHLPI